VLPLREGNEGLFHREATNPQRAIHGVPGIRVPVPWHIQRLDRVGNWRGIQADENAVHNCSKYNVYNLLTIYRQPSIISGTGAAILSKTNFGPTGHHQARNSPLPRVRTVPIVSANFEMRPGSVFSTACDLHPSPQLCQNGGLLVLPAIGEQEKSRVGGGWQSYCFWSKIPSERGSVREYVVVMQQPVLLSPKFGTKSLHIFTRLTWNVRVVCGIDCLAYQHEFFVNNPLDDKENDEHAPNFSLHLSHFSRSRWVCTFYVRLMLPSPNACLLIARV
jgi:hypothetical protein